MIYFIFICILLNGLKIVIDYRKKKAWEEVKGIITSSTVQTVNWGTNDYVIYEFLYDGVLYENREEFVYEDRPYNITEVTVYINPKDIYKSTIKPIKMAESLMSLVLLFLFFSGMIVYRLFIKRS